MDPLNKSYQLSVISYQIRKKSETENGKLETVNHGFTLIEALAVIAVLGILASLTVFTFNQAAKNGRDARRQADLAAVAFAFQARYDSLTCSNQADLGRYPGRDLDFGIPREWHAVGELAAIIDSRDCGPFSLYLTVLPTDPNNEVNYPYKFNLSSENSIVGKHYRLGTRLERTSQQWGELDKMSAVWTTTFGGAPFLNGYTYFVGN